MANRDSLKAQMASPESEALRVCTTTINKTLSSSVSLSWFADVLYEKNFVELERKNSISTSPDNYDKASSLMGAVTARVSAEPESFHAFVAILEGEPALNAVVKELLEKYGTLASDCHGSHSTQPEEQDGPWLPEKKCCSKKLHVDGQQRMRDMKELDKELRRTRDELKRVREEGRQLRKECESKEIQVKELEEQNRMMEEEYWKERGRWEKERERLILECESEVAQCEEVMRLTRMNVELANELEHLMLTLYQKCNQELAHRRYSSSSSLHKSPSVYSLYAVSSPKWRGSTQSLQHPPMCHPDPPHCNEPEQGHGANERITDTSQPMESCPKPQEEQQQWLRRFIPTRWYPARWYPAARERNDSRD